MAPKTPKTVGEIVVNDRGQFSLAKVRLAHRYDRFVVEEFPGGTIVLTPVVLTPAASVTNDELAAITELRSRAGAGEPE